MQEDLLAAIETLYDCADTHFDYQRAVSTLSRQTDDTGFMIGKLSLPGKITSYAYTNVPDGAIEAVTRKRWSRDNHKFIKLFPYLPVGMPVLRRTMHSDEDCHQTELWRTTCRPWGIHSEGTCILKRGLFGGEAMSFVRLPGQEEIDHDLLSRMILLIKHLRRAMLLHARVSMVEEALIMSNKALDLMEHGLVLLADDGEMLFVNSAAERIFDAGDGLSLRNNSIAIANADAKEKFCAMMEKVMQPGIPLSMRAGGYVKVPRKSFGRPYGLMAVPLPRTSSADLDAVGTAIFVFDPKRSSPPSLPRALPLRTMPGAKALRAIRSRPSSSSCSQKPARRGNRNWLAFCSARCRASTSSSSSSSRKRLRSRAGHWLGLPLPIPRRTPLPQPACRCSRMSG